MVTEYYYEKLSGKDRNIYRLFQEAILRQEQEVTLPSPVTHDYALKILGMVGKDHPELFYVEFHRIKHQKVPEGMRCLLLYTDEKSCILEKKRKIEKTINHLLLMAQEAGLKNDFMKVKWIHDRLVRNIVYHDEAKLDFKQHPDAFTVEGVFLGRRAVCAGIANAYKLLADRLGVWSAVVTGESRRSDGSDSGPHGWNIVKIQDRYYHIDVTWDGSFSNSSKYYRYDYFCLTDREIKRDHIYNGYPECNCEAMSYFKKQNRIFSEEKELLQYMTEERKKGKGIFYFKIAQGSSLDCGEEIKTVEKIVWKVFPAGKTFQIEFNKDQKIFFVSLENI